MNQKIKLAIIGAGEWGKTHAYLEWMDYSKFLFKYK